MNTLTTLNEMWTVYKTEIEREFNKNSIDFGDLNPGNIYILPIVVDYQTDLNEKAFAGRIKDFNLPYENSKANIKLTRMLGYTFACRMTQYGHDYMIKNMRGILEELKLTLKNATKITPEDAHYGYYIKLSDFKEVPDFAAYQLTIESNVIPMIQLCRKSENNILRS